MEEALNNEVQRPDNPPADPSPAEATAPAATTPDWVPKRLAEITAARRAAEAERDQMKAELERLRAAAPVSTDGQQPAISPQALEDLANARAEAIANQKREQETFNNRITSINEAGMKEFGEDFDKSVQTLTMAGVGGPEFLKVLTNVPNAEKVVTYLGKPENVGEAIRIANLDPVSMAVEMTKMAATAAKALAKQVSKVPPPLDTIDGGSSASDGVEPPPNSKEWFAWRAKTARKRR
ncbi:hypothetical protein [Ralstonia pseudosolanacearum]|uniref:hypothetical protein n=1 Tax=Ralstonia pseudosolanacearum TaxID=1310165 RepID=UPI0011C4929E